ncbi:hypothetical protein YTPLAS18_06480 [Nitrospira sp.]|nr:hypothetical protein YTPLAS18_06480 [Nitrospira sp.]
MSSETGLINGNLKPCPSSPNCVSTQAEDDQHRIQPYRYRRDRALAIDALKQAVGSMRGARLAEEHDSYLRFEFTSRWFRFVDDVEFLFDDRTHTVQFRSASRTGYSDLGVNRKRMEDIRGKVEGLL